MRLSDLMIRSIAAVVAAALTAVPAMAAEPPQDAAGTAVDTDRGYVDEPQAEERAQMQRLRRAREQHEANRAQAARRREAEQARQAEAQRLHTDVQRLDRDASTFHHDTRQLRGEIHLISKVPADHSAIARRGELERRLNDQQLRLHQTTASRDEAMRRLDQIRFR